MLDESRPIFLQIADRIADDVLRGVYAEGDQVPSTNEFAAFHRINPATAGKGVNLLVDRGVLFKKRGIGMFVADGARARIAEERRREFAERYLEPLLAEAQALGLTTRDVVRLVEETDPAHDPSGSPRTAHTDREDQEATS
ncbi:GntR family transcriptional regulator [Leucobacter allii]|uniref:GntR family transcriptional regulator n=1 Tax=Leucobacter allii TaxID=2932247 RepID=A0ABY4FM28_9MICO|nr:GntR family transcriptional regulator [Leucobacter allii]UOQ57293.1 GntR family transcriptional regulator [Leucobacter allii]UOR01742.1 GntR family transcriptional regulator [Leucobacter allii]